MSNGHVWFGCGICIYAELGSKGNWVDEGSAGLHGVMGVRVLEPDIRGSKAERGGGKGDWSLRACKTQRGGNSYCEAAKMGPPSFLTFLLFFLRNPYFYFMIIYCKNLFFFFYIVFCFFSTHTYPPTQLFLHPSTQVFLHPLLLISRTQFPSLPLSHTTV